MLVGGGRNTAKALLPGIGKESGRGDTAVYRDSRVKGRREEFVSGRAGVWRGVEKRTSTCRSGVDVYDDKVRFPGYGLDRRRTCTPETNLDRLDRPGRDGVAWLRAAGHKCGERTPTAVAWSKGLARLAWHFSRPARIMPRRPRHFLSGSEPGRSRRGPQPRY